MCDMAGMSYLVILGYLYISSLEMTVADWNCTNCGNCTNCPETCMQTDAGAIIGALIGGIILAFVIMVGIVIVLHVRQQMGQRQNKRIKDAGAQVPQDYRDYQPSILDIIRGKFRGTAFRRNNSHVNKSYEQTIVGVTPAHNARNNQPEPYELADSQKFKGGHSKGYDLATLHEPNSKSNKPASAGTISYDHIGQFKPDAKPTNTPPEEYELVEESTETKSKNSKPGKRNTKSYDHINIVKPSPNSKATAEGYDLVANTQFKGDNSHEYYNLTDRDTVPKKPDIALPDLPEIYENIALESSEQ